jgi:hypothetical protein
MTARYAESNRNQNCASLRSTVREEERGSRPTYKKAAFCEARDFLQAPVSREVFRHYGGVGIPRILAKARASSCHGDILVYLYIIKKLLF